MSRDRDRERKNRHNEERPGEEPKAHQGEYREDCPCPKVKCENRCWCEPCREKHTKSKPYCERSKA